MFLELAVSQGKLKHFLATTRRLGYPIVEVSDNVVSFDRSQKAEIIRTAVEEHGLTVLAEGGSKRIATAPGELIDDAKASLAAGAWKVLVEAAEFFVNGRFNEAFAVELASALPMEHVIFELPGAWIPGIQRHAVHSMMVWLVDRFGPDANIANVDPGSILTLETLRTGVGVTMSLPSAPTPPEDASSS